MKDFLVPTQDGPEQHVGVSAVKASTNTSARASVVSMLPAGQFLAPILRETLLRLSSARKASSMKIGQR
jgi:hypothetical protein